MYTLRDFNPETDFPRLTSLLNLNETEPVTEDFVRLQHERRDRDDPFFERVAVNGDDQVIGHGYSSVPKSARAGDCFIGVRVDPDYRNRGIGSTVYDMALEFALLNGTKRLVAWAHDTNLTGQHFAQKRGYNIDRHLFESLLEIATFDSTPYNAGREALEKNGIRFTSLQDLGNTDENRHKVLEILNETAVDIPGFDQPPVTYDDLMRYVYSGPDTVTDGTLIALDGSQWAGITVMIKENDELLINYMTGIRVPYRGRGIASALKALAIEWSRGQGAQRILTNNDSQNAPMLAINRKMGYNPLPGRYRMIRVL